MAEADGGMAEADGVAGEADGGIDIGEASAG